MSLQRHEYIIQMTLWPINSNITEGQWESTELESLETNFSRPTLLHVYIGVYMGYAAVIASRPNIFLKNLFMHKVLSQVPEDRAQPGSGIFSLVFKCSPSTILNALQSSHGIIWCGPVSFSIKELVFKYEIYSKKRFYVLEGPDMCKSCLHSSTWNMSSPLPRPSRFPSTQEHSTKCVRDTRITRDFYVESNDRSFSIVLLKWSLVIVPAQVTQEMCNKRNNARQYHLWEDHGVWVDWIIHEILKIFSDEMVYLIEGHCIGILYEHRNIGTLHRAPHCLCPCRNPSIFYVELRFI
jgi:hypothetical protein